MEPLPSIPQQIRDQSGGASITILKRLILWAMIFGAATLMWWQIDAFADAVHGWLHGDGWPGGWLGTWWVMLGLATLGLVMAVCLATVACLATDIVTGALSALLIFTPVVLFDRWEPIWIWYALGPAAAALAFFTASVRFDTKGELKPGRALFAVSFWGLIIAWSAAQILTAWALEETGDDLRPADFDEIADCLNDWLPEEATLALIDILPDDDPPPPRERNRDDDDGDGEDEDGGDEEEAQPTSVPERMLAKGDLPKQFGIPTPSTAPASAPTSQPTADLDPDGVNDSADGEVVGRLSSMSDSERQDAIALGLFHIVSTQGAGYSSEIDEPLLVPLGALTATVGLLPFVVGGLIAAPIVGGILLGLLRLMGFVRKVTVRIELYRYTLRGAGAHTED